MKKRIIKNLLRQVRQLEDDRSQLVLENEALSRAVSKRPVTSPVAHAGDNVTLFSGPGSAPGVDDQTRSERLDLMRKALGNISRAFGLDPGCNVADTVGHMVDEIREKLGAMDTQTIPEAADSLVRQIAYEKHQLTRDAVLKAVNDAAGGAPMTTPDDLIERIRTLVDETKRAVARVDELKAQARDVSEMQEVRVALCATEQETLVDAARRLSHEIYQARKWRGDIEDTVE